MLDDEISETQPTPVMNVLNAPTMERISVIHAEKTHVLARNFSEPRLFRFGGVMPSAGVSARGGVYDCGAWCAGCPHPLGGG